MASTQEEADKIAREAKNPTHVSNVNGFDPEDKIRYNDLAPSLQAYIDSKLSIFNSFKSWEIQMWESHEVFRDLEFYEFYDVVQTGSNTRITNKDTMCIWGDMNSYYKNHHPMWVKHQQVFTTPDGVSRIFLGCGEGDSSAASIYMSDKNGLNFEKVFSYGGYKAFWDLAVFGNAIYALAWGGGADTLVKSTDGVNWVKVREFSGSSKQICVWGGRLWHITQRTSYYTSDGENWSSIGNDFNHDSIYSRYCSNDAIYIGSSGGDSSVFVSKDASHFTRLWGGEYSYIRWLCPWTPSNGDGTEYVVWGTGGTGVENGTAQLWMYNPKTGATQMLYNFRDGSGSINDGHAPLEPRNANMTPIGFRERQIRFIQVFDNDYTGENFLMIGCSDNHLYAELHDTDIYYKTGEAWSDHDKLAWLGDNITGADTTNGYGHMGNVYAVGPRDADAKFNPSDLVISLIKHTEDTRIYSMSIYYDSEGKKWAYAGTGGGNYDGKGLLYRFGYGDMLDIIQGSKMGAVMPPKWEIRGKMNPHIVQTSSSFYMKLIGGCSARDAYIEGRFAFIYKTVLPSDPKYPPYYGLIFNHNDAANYYMIQFRPVDKTLVVVECTNNVQHIRGTFSIPDFETYDTIYMNKDNTFNDDEEAINAPRMGPFYLLGVKINDETMDVYYKKSYSRTELPTVTDIVGTIDVTNNRKIGRYGIAMFDVKGMSLISMKQMSIAKFEGTAFAEGALCFHV